MRVPNVFTDPAGRVAPYAWPLNHNTESPIQKSRQMGDGAPTANVGLIPQQGPPTPLILQWKGTILTLAHYQAMLQWWTLCDGQTIYITDYSGAEYEVIITDFAPNAVAVSQNRNDPVNAPYNIWEYDLTMRVVKVRSGPWVGVAA